MATTLISARPPSGMLALAATLRLTGPMAAFNGGTLFDTDGTIRFAHRLEAADAAAMLRLLDRPGVTLWVYADGAWFVAGLDNPHLARERLAAGGRAGDPDRFRRARRAHRQDRRGQRRS